MIFIQFKTLLALQCIDLLFGVADRIDIRIYELLWLNLRLTVILEDELQCPEIILVLLDGFICTEPSC